jgi:hypothetical protein
MAEMAYSFGVIMLQIMRSRSSASRRHRMYKLKPQNVESAVQSAAGAAD